MVSEVAGIRRAVMDCCGDMAKLEALKYTERWRNNPLALFIIEEARELLSGSNTVGEKEVMAVVDRHIPVAVVPPAHSILWLF